MSPFNFRSILTGKMLVVCAAILVALVMATSSHEEPEPQEAERAVVVCPPGRAMPNPSTATMPDGTVIDVNSMWHTEALEEWPK